MTRLLESLTVFYGELTPNRAVVHAHLAGGEDLAELTLAGIVRGPRCSRGSTLPATYRLVGQASGLPGQVENLLHVAALITEPIFWSPDWPALYDVTVELRRGSQIIEQTARTIGFRPLAVVGKTLAYGGKTWVLRGVQRDHPLDAEVRQCREHAAALVAPAVSLDDRLLLQASEEGGLVVARIAAADPSAELLRMSRFAAVAVAVWPPASAPFGSAAPGNILLAQSWRQGQSGPPPDSARLVIAEVLDVESFADWAQTQHRPIIAYRPLPDRYETIAARMECDRLQRDLAPYGQFAGYIV